MNIITYGLTVTGIGLFIVFLGLGILIGVLYLMAAIFTTVNKRKAEAAQKPVQVSEAPAAAEAPAQDVVGDELIAVIAAAIAAFDGTANGLVVKSVRRVNGWKNAARSEQLNKF